MYKCNCKIIEKNLFHIAIDGIMYYTDSLLLFQNVRQRGIQDFDMLL